MPRKKQEKKVWTFDIDEWFPDMKKVEESWNGKMRRQDKMTFAYGKYEKFYRSEYVYFVKGHNDVFFPEDFYTQENVDRMFVYLNLTLREIRRKIDAGEGDIMTKKFQTSRINTMKRLLKSRLKEREKLIQKMIELKKLERREKARLRKKKKLEKELLKQRVLKNNLENDSENNVNNIENNYN